VIFQVITVMSILNLIGLLTLLVLWWKENYHFRNSVVHCDADMGARGLITHRFLHSYELCDASFKLLSDMTKTLIIVWH
jgi:hypothetical protein